MNRIQNPKTERLMDEFYFNPPADYYTELKKFFDENQWSYGEGIEHTFRQYL